MDEQPKAAWVYGLPSGESITDRLDRTLDDERVGDRDEKIHFWMNQDPADARLEASQRSFRGQYLRRLRRLASPTQHPSR